MKRIYKNNINKYILEVENDNLRKCSNLKYGGINDRK